jgi:hypothetical protein
MYTGINSHRKDFQARVNVVQDEAGNLVAGVGGTETIKI